MKANFIVPALISLLVVESVVLGILVENQAKLDDLVLSASEYRSRLISMHSLDMKYFRLLQVNVRGRTLTLPVEVSGADYMGYRDRVRQNFSIRYDLIDFRDFVTPNDPAILAIGRALQGSFQSDLDVAEAALDITHQMYYYSPPGGNWYMKYPVETIVEGSGLCAHLSVLVASLLEACGVDAVLIVYANPEPSQAGHMNVGVLLDSEPFPGASYVERGGKRYYVAETTNYMFSYEYSFTWDGSWKVGQMPSFLAGWETTTIEV